MKFQVSSVVEDDVWSVEFVDSLWLADQENVASFVVKDSSYEISSMDWIGIYKVSL